jgi:SAM-dependent methyltransferase/uncharacterized protein YbaR (Trm112 family)
LCCPVDQTAPLRIEGGKWSGQELVEGELTCPTCAKRFPVEAGIANFLSALETQDPMVAFAKDRESKARDKDSSVYDGTVSSYHSQVELGALLHELTPRHGDLVLDLGAGTGRLTVELARRGASVLAMDISPRSLERNRARCQELGLTQVHHLVVDACHLSVRDGVANKAASAMMLEHLPSAEERARCVKEIRRVLKPLGTLALTAYNYSLRKRRKFPREGFHGSDLYFYNLDRRETRGLLTGFQVQRLTAILNLPGNLHWLALDRLISKAPPLALLLGQLLLVAARSEVLTQATGAPEADVRA